MLKIQDKILTVALKPEVKVLREKTREFIFLGKTGARVGDKILGRKEIEELIRRMRKIMREARGVGLSANQIGLPFRLFVAEIPDPQGNPKFYAVFNPKLELEEKRLKKVPLEEGCLSVPGTYGEVERLPKVKLLGLDKAGRPLKIRAWGLLAHVFQHEVDHLNGKLFTDKAKNLRRIPVKEALNLKS